MMKRIKHRKPRIMKMDPELADAMRQQLELFKQKFGREPGPDEPVFFDPDADTPQPYPQEKMHDEMVTIMRTAGIDEAKIYAYQKTGMMVTQENYNQWSKGDLEEYRQAIEEYRRSLQ